MTANNIPETIIDRLGGRRFMAMTGTTDFVVFPTGVQFSFAGSSRANECVIILQGDDLYNVQMWKISSKRYPVCKNSVPGSSAVGVRDIDSEHLAEYFSNFTGLDVRL